TLLTISFLTLTNTANAETLESIGISTTEGLHFDNRHRYAKLTVEENVTEGNVQLLANVFVESKDTNLYPVKLEFYINGQLFATQITTPTLPRPVGVDIGTDVASVPFNYTVVASVLHPNRTIHTVIEGVAFGTDLQSTLNCTLTLNAGTESPSVFTAENIETTQTGTDTFDLVFDAISTDAETLSVNTTVTVTGETASAILDLNNGITSSQISVTGSAVSSDSSLSSFELQSEAGTTTLSCS
ncbi:MAG: hypothetical protein KDD56_10335, partial [Bdellovibrionales bacterium]|nr:hypothetical protein [Bdellovibrionales bacterium]